VLTSVIPQRFLALLVSAIFVGIGAPVAGAAPIITLGPVSVVNGLVRVSGTVGGTSFANAQVTVNGRLLGLSSSGAFSGVVDLNGASAVTIAVPEVGRGTAVIQLPLRLLGPSGQLPSGILDSLNHAGIALDALPGGFHSTDAQPVTVSGRVAEPGRLSAFSVNGTDALDSLGPEGSFSMTVPGTTKKIAVSATDRNGVSQTSTYGVSQLSSVIHTAQGTSVAATGAKGVRIAKVQYVLRRVQHTKRLRMIVTVKDRRGYFVRGAKVRVLPSWASRTRVHASARTLPTSRTGMVSFIVRVNANAFGKRVALVAIARTPTAHASRTTSVRLPRKA
jgi:hypothetical protein